MIIDSRFEVIEVLGTGVWATVYKVKDIRTDNIYALKLFHKLDSDSLYAKFSAEEMHHITQIKHPNLIRVISFGNDGKHIYSLNEFFDGKSLNYFKFSTYNIDLFYDILFQICKGLYALHNHDIIHKDIKPENILFKEVSKQNSGALSNLEVKILDYGFTKIDLEKSQKHISGTLPYIAPEIFLGKKAVPQTDFYSLGVTLYKITTGSLPYSIDQLTKMLTGEQQNIIPRFPSELNQDIPQKLEKFILELLAEDPQGRLPNVENLIYYINRIQPKKYNFTKEESLLNTIKFSSYFVRKEYSHRLLEYSEMVEKENGRIIILTGGEGSGKNHILTLFKYHLLNEKQLLFDYTCSNVNKDPFFALIKEFISYVSNRKMIEQGKIVISDKLKKYLFDSEEKALSLSENSEELKEDFKFARDFLIELSNNKPLFFIIRAGHNLQEETIKFLNYISGSFYKVPILIIVSVEDLKTLRGLIYKTRIDIRPLGFQETKKYIEKLLRVEIGDEFVNNVLEKTNGNPDYIKETLISLVTKKRIAYDRIDNKKLIFKIDWDKFSIPEKIKHSIYMKLSRLSKENYVFMQKMSICQTPYNNDLIRYILGINDKQLFYLLKECFNYEILLKKDDYYYFTFKEAKKRLFSETTEEMKQSLSTKIISFFNEQTITQIPVCMGIIKNAEIAEDFLSIRKYRLILIELLAKTNQHEKSFYEICEIVKLDFSGKIKITEKELLLDLKIFQETAELTGLVKTAIKILDTIENFPDIFEKFFIKGILFTAVEKYDDAEREIKTSFEVAITGKQRVNALINIVWVYYRKNDYHSAMKYIEILDKMEISKELEIAYIDRKALILDLMGKKYEAIQLIEDFLPHIEISHNTNFYVRLGNLYNNLGILYTNKKMLNRAGKHFNSAKKLWEQVNYIKALGTLYNNIGDLYLKQGDTNSALHFFEKAKEVCYETEQKLGQVLVNLNFGETYIKKGKFLVAEKYLNTALEETSNNQGMAFLDSINWNFALLKSKIINFYNLFIFLEKNYSHLFDFEFTEITPLVKAFIYFMFEIAKTEYVNKIMTRNPKIDYFKQNEEDFYYQILGLIDYQNGEYLDALSYFFNALESSQKNNNVYSQTILFLRIAQCYTRIEDLDQADDYLNKAESLAISNDYFYWLTEIKIAQVEKDLLDREISLRIILRKLYNLIADVKKNKYFLLEIRIYEIIFSIYQLLKYKPKMMKYYDLHQEKVKLAIENLPATFQETYLKKKKITAPINEFPCFKINERINTISDSWVELLYELLTFNEVDRIKFFVDKILFDLLSPNFYSIELQNESSKDFSEFLSYNQDELKRVFSERSKLSILIENSMNKNEIVFKKTNNVNIAVIPLKIKSAVAGVLILGDSGELPFTRKEVNVLKILKLHFTSILIRIKSYTEINTKMELMQKVMNNVREFFSIIDIDKLENEFISFCVDFTKCSRCFLIKKDQYGNYLYQVALDGKKHILRRYTHISKTVISEVQQLKSLIYTTNAREDNLLKNSISVQDYALHSIFCAPIMVDDKIHALLYLDDYEKDKKPKGMEVNIDFMKILLIQISLAVKNALQYSDLMKKNAELYSLDKVKNEFANIVSHELNTPLLSMKNILSKLKREEAFSTEDKSQLVENLDDSMNKLSSRINDIINFNKYKMLSKIEKQKTSVEILISSMIERMQTISKERKMVFKKEIQKNLPEIEVNPEAFNLMLYNIILNSIRYTKDFGTIKVGARLSAFQQEEIDNRESLVIYIQDNGMGIPESQLKTVFKPFCEGADLYAHHSGFVDYKSCGLGIGLAVATRIAELHGGRITINSKEDEGSTVFIIVPLTGHEKK